MSGTVTESQAELWVRRFLLFMRAERNASANTICAYQQDMKEFLRFLKDSSPDFSNFRKLRLLVREYWVLLSKKEGCTATVVRKLAVLRSFFKFLVRENAVESNPFDYLPAPKREKILPNFLSEKEISSFLTTIERSQRPLAIRDRALVELLYSSGLRIQEAMDLNVGDVDLWNGMVKVFGKGGRERLVPMGESAVACIEKYLKQREKKAAVFPKSAVFLNARGSRITARGVRKILNGWLRQTTIQKRVNPHVFRHTFATHLLNRGCDLRMVQEMLGHKSLSSTQLYTHASVEHLKKVYENAHPRA